tara:strand:- start:672 stop:824 length:153 start_codon:yes stop_codon:yes gene_type:complete
MPRHEANAFESEIFSHFRNEEIKKLEAIKLLKKSGYIVYEKKKRRKINLF